MKYPDVYDLCVDEIRNKISGLNLKTCREILFFSVTGSTNMIAAELAAKGQRQGTVIIADSQTEGRGRRGRTWISPKGKNLYLSVIVRPVMQPADAPILTLMSAVACIAAMQKLSSAPLSIKWPNDLMADDKKLGGILTEIKTGPGGIDYAVVGIGININLDFADMPDDIKKTATSIMLQTGRPQSRTECALEIIKSFDYWYAVLSETGKDRILESWLDLCSTIGCTVAVTTGQGTVTGLAEGIDADGALIVRCSDNSIRKVREGDVSINMAKGKGRRAQG